MSLFSRTVKWKKSLRERNQQSTSRSRVSLVELENQLSRDALISEESLSDAQREVYKFKEPETESNFESLLGTYKVGERFQYVAITSRKPESCTSRVRRLVAFTSDSSREEIPTSKLPNLRLVEESEQICLSSAISHRRKEYIRLKAVTGLYVPLDSSHSIFTKVRVTLHDKRRRRDTAVQSLTFNYNLCQNFEFSLDYCIPRADASQIVLDFSKEMFTLKEGYQWGAVTMQIKVEEASFPFMCEKAQALSVLSQPHSMLDKHDVNPDHADTLVLESQRLKILKIYENGDIADCEPVREKLKSVTYAQSSAKAKVLGEPSSKKFPPGWEHMDNYRITEEFVADQLRVGRAEKRGRLVGFKETDL